MHRIITGCLIVAVALIALGPGQAARAQVALGCLDFPTWEQAQAAHVAAPWMNLDPDGNGIACDCLRLGLPC